MSKVAYYPGCALEGSGGPYDRSTRALVDALDLEMETLKDWNCCGAMEVKNVHPMLQTYMSARNMAIADGEDGPRYGDGPLQRLLSQPEEGGVRVLDFAGDAADGAGPREEGR